MYRPNFSLFRAGLMALAICAAGPALAVPVTFDLTGSTANLGTSHDFGTTGGVSLVVNGFDYIDPDGATVSLPSGSGSGTNPTTYDIVQGSVGLGVKDDGRNAAGGDRVGREQALQFVLSPDALLVSALAFETGGSDEKFALFDSNNNRVYNPDNLGDNGSWIVPGGPGDGPHTVDFSAVNLVGPYFTIVGLSAGPDPIGPDGKKNRGFTVSAITVSAVPIPAALPLLASGIGGLGFMGWRRKQRTSRL